MFYGHTVVSGTAQAMVIATGANTWLVNWRGVLVSRKASRMPFSRDQPRQYAADSLYAGDGSGGVLINGYTKGDWWEAALFALSAR